MRITKPPVSSSVSKCPTISRSARRTRMADPRPAARVNQSARTATKFSALFHCSIRSTILRESVAKSDTAETPIQAAARSVAGYSVLGGWLTQFTPIPMTTAPAPSPSMRTPANLASPRRRSLGHLIARLGFRGPAASLTASCTARAATKANSGHRSGGAGFASRRLAKRFPASDIQIRPRRPRPPLWRSATTQSGPRSPALARASASELVETTMS